MNINEWKLKMYALFDCRDKDDAAVSNHWSILYCYLHSNMLRIAHFCLRIPLQVYSVLGTRHSTFCAMQKFISSMLVQCAIALENQFSKKVKWRRENQRKIVEILSSSQNWVDTSCDYHYKIIQVICGWK